jgi:hypothetical protein
METSGLFVSVLTREYLFAMSLSGVINMTNLRFRRYHYHISPKAGVIYCDSSYEIKAALILDNDEDVLFYETQIQFDGQNKKRFLDFLATYKSKAKVVIEVKPKTRLMQFEEQINDNRQYALSNGYGFEVWTENELGFRNDYAATKWADEYLSQFHGVDYTEIRKQNGLKRAKRHYRKKIATEKITFYCEFCKEEHSPLRLSYEKNIKKNGRFICIKENGYITGSLPKTKNENLVERQCKKCSEVLPMDQFSKGKAICKKCRAAIYKEKYQSELEVKRFKYISKKDLWQ